MENTEEHAYLFKPMKTEILGWVLGVVWLVGVVGAAIVQPVPYADAYRLVLELAIFGGRAVSIGDGVANGFGQGYLFFQCGLQDIAMTLILYPWVLRAFHGAEGLGVLGRFLRALHKSTEKYRRILEPFGVVGVWLFVFFPFWSTGVLNGVVLGYLLGLRIGVNFITCFSSHLVSTVALLLFYERLSVWLESVGSGAMQFIPWVVLGTLLLGFGVQTLWEKRRAKNDAKDNDVDD